MTTLKSFKKLLFFMTFIVVTLPVLCDHVNSDSALSVILRGMFGGGNNVEKELFNLKFAAKNLVRSSQKCEKEEKAETLKLKKAIQKGNMEGARIYAENAIRQKYQSKWFVLLAVRVDAVSQRVQTAVTMKQVTPTMRQVVREIDVALKSMDLEEVWAVIMDFDQRFEQLDNLPPSALMDQAYKAWGGEKTLKPPQSEIDCLIYQSAKDHGLEVDVECPEGGEASLDPLAPDTPEEEYDIEKIDINKLLGNIRQ